MVAGCSPVAYEFWGSTAELTGGHPVEAPSRLEDFDCDLGNRILADVDDLLQRVEALGGRALGQPNDMPWDQRVAYIEDRTATP